MPEVGEHVVGAADGDTRKLAASGGVLPALLYGSSVHARFSPSAPGALQDDDVVRPGAGGSRENQQNGAQHRQQCSILAHQTGQHSTAG